MKTKNKRVIKKFNTRNFNFKKLFLNHFKKFNTRKLENIHISSLQMQYVDKKLKS